MNVLLPRLAAFAGRHWLRLGLVVFALVLLTQKQINFNLRLGHPDGDARPTAVPEAPVAEGEPQYLTEEQDPVAEQRGGFFSRFHFFGGGAETADHYTQLLQRGDAGVDAFLTRFGHVAQAEQEKFGIPASVTLATALLYSRAGSAAGARTNNNYFALGCTADWNGATDRIGGDCQRSYESAWTSFRDFSLYVTSGSFDRMKQIDAHDYRRWAAGLQELGFNGNDQLAGELQQTIDRYQLFRFD